MLLVFVPGSNQQDAVHITAILGESVVFNCHVEFPGDHPVPYVLQWEKKVGETVGYHSDLCSLLFASTHSLLVDGNDVGEVYMVRSTQNISKRI